MYVYACQILFLKCKQMPRVARANKPQSKEWAEKIVRRFRKNVVV